jgi:hypothetical protein
MTVDLNRSYRRWLAAEAEGRDDDADAEFGAVFETAPQPGVSAAFTARTMEAVAAAGARAARRARRARMVTAAAGVAGMAATVYYGAGMFGALLTATVTRTFDLLIGLVLNMAGAAETGAGVWSVLTGVGRTAVAVVADPTVTMMLFALQGVAVAALIALQRLLGADEESFK